MQDSYDHLDVIASEDANKTQIDPIVENGAMQVDDPGAEPNIRGVGSVVNDPFAKL